jgi:hypothetical protein
MLFLQLSRVVSCSTILTNFEILPFTLSFRNYRPKREHQKRLLIFVCKRLLSMLLLHSFDLGCWFWWLVLWRWVPWRRRVKNDASFASFPEPPCWQQSYPKHLSFFWGLDGGDHHGAPLCDRDRGVPIASSSCLHQRQVSCFLVVRQGRSIITITSNHQKSRIERNFGC